MVVFRIGMALLERIRLRKPSVCSSQLGTAALAVMSTEHDHPEHTQLLASKSMTT